MMLLSHQTRFGEINMQFSLISNVYMDRWGLNSD